jgi:hypothetical protein
MTWLVFTDQVIARRFCAAVDRHASMDYPRDHADNEPAFVRGVRANGVARTESKTRLLHNGTQAAVWIDDSVDALHGQQVQITDGGLRTITIATSGAGITRSAGPPAGWTTTIAANPWVDRPPRDGLGGAR